MNLRPLAQLLPVVALFSNALAQQALPIFPFEPAQLLGTLPAAPAEWQIIRSEAETTLGEWLETRATRVFQAPLEPAMAPASTPAAPRGEVEITVVDTAGFTPALAAFADFAPGKNGGLEKKVIGSLPAIIITSEDGRQFMQVLVSARYLIEITITHLPRHRAEDWLRSLHFERLPQKASAPAVRPREFRLSRVDELNPKNNRSYAVSTTGAKRVNDFLKTLPLDHPEPALAEPNSGGQP